MYGTRNGSEMCIFAIVIVNLQNMFFMGMFSIQ